VLRLQDLGCLDALPCRGDLDEDAFLVDANLLVELRSLVSRALHAGASGKPTSMMCSALSTDCWVLKENRASTSVDTFPGMICRISLPNCTSRLSRVASTWASTSLPCFLPYATAASMSFAYSGFLEAARMSEGFVVASCGLYLSMVAKSPESQTTV